jgi:hypothetical protein
MNKFLTPIAFALLTPSLGMANGYENSDYATVYIQDFENVNPIGVGGRFAISPMGKIVGDATFFSDEEEIFGTTFSTSSAAIRGGYRHTFGELDFFTGGVWSLGGGVTYASVTVEVEGFSDVTADETDFYIEGDVEYPIGQSGVAHGVVVLQGGDFNFGGGYTHYVNSQVGVRGEFILDGAIEIGGMFRF